jgi:predicted nucleic acid-binding protein
VAVRRKAVIDTQIVVRGLARLKPSSAAVQVFERAMNGELAGVTSPVLLGEVRQTLRVVRTLTGWTDDEIRRAVEHVASRLIVVPGRIGKLRQIVPEDLRDNPLFEAALEADAEFVVSEDRAVLGCKRVEFSGYRGIEVVAPRPFLRLLDA